MRIRPETIGELETIDIAYSRISHELETEAEKRNWNFPNDFYIDYGNKVLKITISPTEGTALTHIRNKPAPNPKEEGATTLLYTITKEFIQKIANRLGREINYQLETGNAKMKVWAEINGQEIFGWDTVTENHSSEVITPYRFTKKFIPETHE